MEDADRETALPTRGAGDYAHTLVKAGLSALPHIGGSAAELFALIIAPPLEKRRDDWLRDLADVVKKLEQRKPGIEPHDLSKNDAFISATLQATQIAMRTHQADKRGCLKNALFHVATETSTDDDTQAFFLALIDAFTVTHIEILRLFGNRAAFPTPGIRALEANRKLTDPIVLDLNARGLLNDLRPFAARMREPLQSLVTDSWTLSALGVRFLGFISE